MNSNCAYSKANWISKLFFWWILPLVQLGRRKELNEGDIHKLPPNNSAQKLELIVTKAWKKELSTPNPKLRRAITSSFGFEFFYVVLLVGFREIICRIGQLYCLFLILGSLDGTDKIGTGNVACCALFLLLFLNAATNQVCNFKAVELSLQVRVAVVTLIYRKVLSLSLGTSSFGQISNLISNDLNRFERYMVFWPYIFVAPFQFLIVAYLLWSHIGFSAVGGLAFLLVIFPSTQLTMGQWYRTLRRRCAIETDSRIRITTELINGIEQVKMSTWEEPFSEIIEKARWKELETYLRRYRITWSNTWFVELLMKITQFLIIIVFVTSKQELTGQNVFVLTTTIIFLGSTLSSNLQQALEGFFECLATFERIGIFLLQNEKKEVATKLSDDSFSSVDGGSVILKLDRLCVAWAAHSKPVLSNISLELRQAQLVAIIGSVGSGKSSLLHAVLGEIPSTSGTLTLGSRKVGYVSQDPWVFSGTLLENISFGRQYRRRWFNRVVEACALGPDIARMPHGKNQMIGDRGVTLSGGQRSRINLARAIYADEDFYLLDDPLSGVDANVAELIMSKCIRGLLKSKAVLMVTHQVHHLQLANEILVLNNGVVERRGPYAEIMKTAISTLGLEVSETNEVLLDNENDGEESDSSCVSSIRSRRSRRSQRSHGRLVGVKGRELEESHSLGSTKLALHWDFWSAGGICRAGTVLLLILTTQIIDSSSVYWLKIWINHKEVGRVKKHHEQFYTITYLALLLGFGITSICRNMITIHALIKILEVIYLRVLRSLIRAPMQFFRDNNSGRVMNRLAFDFGVVDDYLISYYRMTLLPLIQGVGYIVLIGIVYPFIFLPALLMFLIFIATRRFYISAGSKLKRIESLARSPIFAILSSTHSGVATIRASQSENYMIRQFYKLQDTHSASLFCYFGAARLYSLLLDMATTAFVFLPIIFCIIVANYDNNATDAATVGLVLSSVLSLSSILATASLIAPDLENGLISVERIFEYTNIPQEAESQIRGRRPLPSWPWNGKIQLSNASLRYGTNPVTLHRLDCSIQSKGKIGVVGRTGAGKSSLITALFRMEELCGGSIHLDGMDISKIGLHDIRSKIFNIPQNPMLFLASLRRNLDPFQRYSDDCLWQAVTDVELAPRFTPPNGRGLDTNIAEEGKNLSPGERQLLCLARALVEKTKVLVLDEATAHVDNKTDAIIQKVIRENFREQTVITIAHRLSTVIDNDKILLLDNGRILEYDHPYILLQNQNGYLYQLCQKTGTKTLSGFLELAKESFERVKIPSLNSKIKS